MSKELKRKIAFLRVVFFILISLLFFLLGFSTSNRRFAEKKSRRDSIYELKIQPRESNAKSKVDIVL